MARNKDLKKACDACHRRKIRCQSESRYPCESCIAAGLECTYRRVDAKKGPKKRKALTATGQPTQRDERISTHRLPLECRSGERKTQLSRAFVAACLDSFITNLSPLHPLFDRRQASEIITKADTDREAYCLITSLCAFVMLHCNIVLPKEAWEDPAAPSQSATALSVLKETLHIRRSFDYAEEPTVWSIITSYFLFGSFNCLQDHRTAWFHLREATTLATVMGIHKQLTSHEMGKAVVCSDQQRLYWVLSITETVYALQHHRPITLDWTVESPYLAEDTCDSPDSDAFTRLLHTFRPFDGAFISIWNKTAPTCSALELVSLQQRIASALPTYCKWTESQEIYLRCSQQWLRAVVWRLSLREGFLCSEDCSNPMSIKFPVQIAYDLSKAMERFSDRLFQAHGTGLTEMVYNIACDLADVISVIPCEEASVSLTLRSHFDALLTLLSKFPNGKSRHLPLLLARTSKLTGK